MTDGQGEADGPKETGGNAERQVVDDLTVPGSIDRPDIQPDPQARLGFDVKNWLAGIVGLVTIFMAVNVALAGPQTGEQEIASISGSITGYVIRPEHKNIADPDSAKACVRCHGGLAQVSHPTDFYPRRELPAEFPMTEHGKMTCNTCHDISRQSASSVRGGEIGQKFCDACHSGSFFARMADEGHSLEASGHLKRFNSARSLIDSYSIQCMECHPNNGTIGSQRMASIGFMAIGGGAANHSIGASYRQAASRGNYRPAASLPKEMLLTDGKVGCLSCHQGYTQQHGKLVLAGNLCTYCHDK